jgi:hypothetical protein
MSTAQRLPAGRPPILILNARAKARAILFALGEFESLDQAVAPLREYAEVTGLVEQFGGDTIDQIILARFIAILGGEGGHA